MKIAVLVFVALLHALHCYNFTDYLVEFKKSYSTPEELALRQSYFDKNYTVIVNTNNQNLGYTLKVNRMTDWTQAQVNEMLGFKLGGDQLINSQTSISGLRKVGASISASVDWRNNGKVTSVKDQGHCGSSWAFAATALYQSFMAQTENQTYDFSEEYLFECTSAGNCSGVPIDKALSLVQNTGMPLESDYPYKAYYTSQARGKPYTSGICSAATFKHSGGVTLFSYRNLSNDDLKTYLNIGPVAVAIWADIGFIFYSGGIYSCQYQASSSNLNHAVQLIGYDTNGNWILKNSWDTTWGVSGFGYLTSSSTGNCGVNIEAYRLFGGRFGILTGLMLTFMMFLIV